MRAVKCESSSSVLPSLFFFFFFFFCLLLVFLLFFSFTLLLWTYTEHSGWSVQYFCCNSYLVGSQGFLSLHSIMSESVMPTFHFLILICWQSEYHVFHYKIRYTQQTYLLYSPLFRIGMLHFSPEKLCADALSEGKKSVFLHEEVACMDPFKKKQFHFTKFSLASHFCPLVHHLCQLI